MDASSYRVLLNISYKDRATIEDAHRKIQAAVGEYYVLLTLVKKRKLRWFGHVSGSSGSFKMILLDTVNGKKNEIALRRGEKTILKNGQA